ncbi:TetR/AcrR family transcriptional regulator [Flindersiella endophytica]
MDLIAQAAGVGNATMYRHFPTRQELIVAVYAEEVEALCAQGRDLLAATDSGSGLFGWLRLLIGHVASKRELTLSVPDGRRSELFARWHDSMRETTAALLDRAKRDGTVRSDLGLGDLLALTHGIALAGSGDDQLARLLGLVRDGLATPDR